MCLATTAFPVMEAMGQVDPGLYVMTAKPGDDLSAAGDEDEELMPIHELEGVRIVGSLTKELSPQI
jgi:hypothetical protein